MPNIRFSTSVRLAAGLAAAALIAPSSASAQTRDHAPVALESAAKLAHDQENSESWTFLQPGLDLSKYRGVFVMPTSIYGGPDAQFDGIEQADRAKYAEILTRALTSEMAGAFPAQANTGPGTLRLHMTILGAKKTKGGVATATRLTTFGLAANALKSVVGKPGTMTGSILLALEVYDGATGELIAGGVRRLNPDALDIPATLSTTDTVKAIARDFAENMRKRLERAHAAGKPPPR